MRKYLLIILSSLLLGHTYYYLTGDFRVADILKKEDLRQTIANYDDEARLAASVLRQTWRYLDAGHQTYAFLSIDKQYILKFFKKNYLERTPYTYFLPPIYPFRTLFSHKGAAKEARLKKLLNGYKLAYSLDRKNCALIFLNFSSENNQLPKIKLVDGLRREFEINVNDLLFAIQQKATPTKTKLKHLLDEGRLDEAQKAVNSILNLYLSQYKKGLLDNDHNFLDNTGFIGDKPVRIDVGKLELNPAIRQKSVYKRDLKKIVEARLLPWIAKKYPQYHDDFRDTFLKEYL